MSAKLRGFGTQNNMNIETISQTRFARSPAPVKFSEIVVF